MEQAGEKCGRISHEERAALYWLCCALFLGAVSIRRLGEYFGGYQPVYNIEETTLRQSGILTEKQADKLLEWRKQFPYCVKRFEKQSEVFVTVYDAVYPERLREIYDYPMGLFVRGGLPESGRPSVAIVGARGCSAYGEQLAEEFARALAGEGVQIISGLAAGIDAAAHRGALKAGKPTFGVLGCGTNICYPPDNYPLYCQMEELGGVISEFPEGTRPIARNFPLRNRIRRGLADGILVVEAREKSGCLITAELGLEQGREIFAVPGRITDHLSAGCNQLIQQGAQAAVSPGDILEYLGVKYRKELILYEKNTNSLAKIEKMVYSCLDFKPRHIDEILVKSGLPLSECVGILLELELGGYVFRAANHYYGKKI